MNTNNQVPQENNQSNSQHPDVARGENAADLSDRILDKEETGSVEEKAKQVQEDLKKVSAENSSRSDNQERSQRILDKPSDPADSLPI